MTRARPPDTRSARREAYLRASNYYRTSYLMHYGSPPASELTSGFERESATFGAFASRADPPLEPVEIPYERTDLPGYFCRAPNVSGRSRTLIATNGYDSTVHEMYFAFAVAAHRRGYHCVLFDGPGQGRALIQQGLPMRPDWENVVRPVINYVLTRPEIDPARVALAGRSFGGYLALRAARGVSSASPHALRIPALPGFGVQCRRCSQICLLKRWPTRARRIQPCSSRTWHASALPALRWKVMQRGFWVHGVNSLAEYLDVARQYTNEAAIDRFVALCSLRGKKEILSRRRRQTYTRRSRCRRRSCASRLRGRRGSLRKYGAVSLPPAHVRLARRRAVPQRAQ